MMDREFVRRVIGLLRESSARELAVREGDRYVRARGSAHVRPAPAARVAWSAATEAAPEEAAAARPGDVVVAARLVGRFYHGKGPGRPPLVTIGDEVRAGQAIATIEALGKLTTVAAPADGVVIEFLADDGQAVEYGEDLVRLRVAQE